MAALFSVLIANYNNGKYLRAAIDSVLVQTYSNWEVIIVDDKSSDNSEAIYQEIIRDSRFLVFYNESNRGCGYTKNRCVQEAHGDICGFLDPDDALDKDAIKTMVEMHLKNIDVGLIYSRFYIADCALVVQGISNQQCQIPNDLSFLEYGKGAISHFAAFKRGVYNRTIGINTLLKRAVDHDLYYLLEEQAPVLFIDVPLYKYRMDLSNSLSLGDNQYRASYWDFISMTEACKRRGLSLENIVEKQFYQYICQQKAISYKQGEDSIRKTSRYLLGGAILAPIRWFRSLFK